MDDVRTGRIAHAMREEIADILQQGLKDPRVGFVSITDVELSNDQRLAKVYCSVMGSDEEKRKALEGLRSATGFIRSAVAKRIRLRHAPEIVFALDESIERGVRVVDMINRLSYSPDEEPKKAGDVAGGGVKAEDKPEGQDPPDKPV